MQHVLRGVANHVVNLLLANYVPALSLIGAVTFALAIHFNVDASVAVFAVSLAAIASAWWLERRAPFRAEWNRDGGDFVTDITSASVLLLIEPLLKLAFAAFVVWSYQRWGMPAPASVFTSLWLEILLVTLFAEFAKYWAHRLHHVIAPLWWLHAMHHGSERLYVINGLRFHPLNYVLNILVSLLPLMLIGVSSEALLGYLAITQPIILVQHANIQLNHGRWNWILSTPEVHRWHHSTINTEANRNYGNALLIWDHVFGTYKSAEGFTRDRRVGLFAESMVYPSRQSYWSQFTSMFKPACCKRA